jgi:hypothetical protein
MSEPRYKIEVTNVYWSCGDGCCSDSGLTIICFDTLERKTIYDSGDWEHCRSWGSHVDECLEKIMDVINNVPERYKDYDIFFFANDYNGNEYDVSESDLEWRK